MLMETGFQVRSDLGREFSLSIYGVLSELGEAPFVASWIVLSKSGIVKNSLFVAFYLILWWKMGYLFTNVKEECITSPYSNDHNHEC